MARGFEVCSRKDCAALHDQIFEILVNTAYEKFTKGQRLALSTLLVKWVLPFRVGTDYLPSVFVAGAN